MKTSLLALALMWLLGGCAGYIGNARSIPIESLRADRGWLVVPDVPLIQQAAEEDCGAAALAMVVAHYEPQLRAQVIAFGEGRGRLSAQEIRDHARSLGFAAFVVEGTPADLKHELALGRPVIVGMAKPTVGGHVAHYEVVIGIHSQRQRIATLDPSLGVREHTFGGFLEEWHGAESVLIVVILNDAASAPLSANRTTRTDKRSWVMDVQASRYSGNRL